MTNIFDRAAEEIVKRGLETNGRLYDPYTHRVCVLGAMSLAAGIEESALSVPSWGIYKRIRAALPDEFELLANLVGGSNNGGFDATTQIYTFNDRSTQDAVLEKLRLASKFLSETPGQPA